MPNCNTVVISLTYASSHFLEEETYEVILWICSDIYLLYSLVLFVSSVAANGKLYTLLYAAQKNLYCRWNYYLSNLEAPLSSKLDWLKGVQLLNLNDKTAMN